MFLFLPVTGRCRRFQSSVRRQRCRACQRGQWAVAINCPGRVLYCMLLQRRQEEKSQGPVRTAASLCVQFRYWHAKQHPTCPSLSPPHLIDSAHTRLSFRTTSMICVRLCRLGRSQRAPADQDCQTARGFLDFPHPSPLHSPPLASPPSFASRLQAGGK